MRFKRTLFTSLKQLAPKLKNKNRLELKLNQERNALMTNEDNNLFSIFLDIPEPDLKNDAEPIPDWVHTLHQIERPSYGALSMMFIYGRGIENAKLDDYKRFLRLHRKCIIELNNMRLSKKTVHTRFRFKHV